MSRLLVVSGDTGIVSRLESSARPDTLEVSSTSWSTWEAGDFTPDTADVVLLDFTGSEGVPAAISARIGPKLEQRSSRPPVVLLMDIQPSAREVLQALVERHGVTVMASQIGADPEAFQGFLESVMAKRVDLPTPERSTRTNLRSLPQVLPALRNPNGRLDARRVSKLFGVPLRRLASAVGADAPAVYKTSDAPGLQEGLRLYERIAKALLQLVGSEEGLRIWLNTPEVELDNEVPRELLLNGEGEAVLDLLEDMLTGAMS